MLDNLGNEIKPLFPINNTPENLFRSIFNKNSMNVLNQMNFLSKNYRPKCDFCLSLCALDFYMQKTNTENEKNLIICSLCYNKDNFFQDLTKEDFEAANFFNIVNSSESK